MSDTIETEDGDAVTLAHGGRDERGRRRIRLEVHGADGVLWVYLAPAEALRLAAELVRRLDL